MNFSQVPLIDGKLPVFIFPPNICFYSNDSSSHKQGLELYNPYDVTLKYKVMCTSPKKYSVVEPEGSVRPKCVGDIVIRHKDVCINNEGARDKFRIQVWEAGQRQVIGSKDVIATLLSKKPDSQSVAEERFESISGVSQSDGSRKGGTKHTPRPAAATTQANNRKGPGWLVITAAILSLIALFLPLEWESSSTSFISTVFTISVNQKILAGYVLGLITRTLLQF